MLEAYAAFIDNLSLVSLMIVAGFGTIIVMLFIALVREALRGGR